MPYLYGFNSSVLGPETITLGAKFLPSFPLKSPCKCAAATIWYTLFLIHSISHQPKLYLIFCICFIVFVFHYLFNLSINTNILLMLYSVCIPFFILFKYS